MEFCLQLPLSLAYIYLAYRSVTFYRANCFTTSLLITNGLAMFLYSICVFAEIITSKHLLDADSADTAAAYNKYQTAVGVLWWVGLYATSCYAISHWIFAFKYWTLAVKVELLKKLQDPNQLNTKFSVVFFLGIIFNLIAGILFQLSIV